MNFSHPIIDLVSGVLGVVFFVVLPLWLIRWLERKAEPQMPPSKSFPGVIVRAGLALVLAAGFLAALFLGMVHWPPRVVTQKKVRAAVAERVKELGGWEAVVKDCDQLLQRPDFPDFHWHSRSQGPGLPAPSGPLPDGLAALKPLSVRVDRHGTNQWAVGVWLHKPMFHKAYGIRIICDAPTNTLPLLAGAPVLVVYNGHQLADRVYEF